MEMIKADSPTLWEIRRITDHATAIAVIIKALIHLARLINIKNDDNLNDVQMGEIANDLLEGMGYLKVEEIKYVLKRAIKREKIFGRLDYNVIMGWFEEYDIERTEHCIDISNQEETRVVNEPVNTTDAISLDEYMARLKKRAGTGDKQAKELLDGIENPPPQRMRLLTAEERHQKDLEFFKWKIEHNKI